MSRRTSRFFRKYFTFTKRESRGILILCSIMLLLIAYRHLHEYFMLPSYSSLNDVEIRWIRDSGVTMHTEKEQPSNFQEAVANYNPLQFDYQKTVKQVEYFYYDPNLISYDSLLLLGLSSKKASTFIKFRKSGAHFKSADDLDKVFSLSEKDLASLKPWVRITPAQEEKKTDHQHLDEKKAPIEKRILLVDINLADSAELIKLQGIGPVLASRIIKYRNRFGAFTNKEQLLEIIGITPEWFDANQSNLILSALPVKKINLNTCTFEELKRHAYFDHDKAKTLINFRTHHGTFKNISDIKMCAAISAEFYKKIEPYISVEP